MVNGAYDTILWFPAARVFGLPATDGGWVQRSAALVSNLGNGERPMTPREMRKLRDLLWEAAEVLANRADQVELYAAKSRVAGRTEAGERKQEQATGLRQLAMMLANPRFQVLMEQDQAGLATMLRDGPKVGSTLIYGRPQKIALASVKPSHPWRRREDDPRWMIR